MIGIMNEIVETRNPCYFLSKKIRVKPRTVLIETVLSGDRLYCNYILVSDKL